MSSVRRGPIESLLLAPFSLLVWVVALSWTALLVGVMWIVSRFVPFPRVQHVIPNPQMGWVLRMTLSRVTIVRDSGYDRRRVSVYCQNHVSMLDGYAGCAAIPQGFCGLENAAHLRIPGYGWMMKMAGAIPVRDRTAGGYRELARTFKQRAEDGVGILTFPEGHRTIDGSVRPFKRGVFRLAKTTGLPIVPIGVRGLFDILPKGTPLIRPFGHVRIHLWPQIETAGLDGAQLDVLSARVRHLLAAYVERGEVLRYEDVCRVVTTAEGVNPESAAGPEPVSGPVSELRR